jgi:hypothetical protein
LLTGINDSGQYFLVDLADNGVKKTKESAKACHGQRENQSKTVFILITSHSIKLLKEKYF